MQNLTLSQIQQNMQLWKKGRCFQKENKQKKSLKTMNYQCSLPSSSLQGNYCFAFQSTEVEEMEF